MFKIQLENTDCPCYSKFVFVRFDLLSNLHDQTEYDIYFVISREANILTTLEIKIETIYSLVNPCGQNKHRYPINKKEKKETEESNSVTIIPHKATRE